MYDHETGLEMVIELDLKHSNTESQVTQSVVQLAVPYLSSFYFFNHFFVSYFVNFNSRFVLPRMIMSVYGDLALIARLGCFHLDAVFCLKRVPCVFFFQLKCVTISNTVF